MDVPMDNNRVALFGRVLSAPQFSHALFGEAFYQFPLIVPRLSGVEDILPITASERLFLSPPQEDQEFFIGGQLRSYNMQANTGNRLLVTVFARQISEQIPSATQSRNEIILNGFICKPPVYRKTPFAREITDLLLAVNRPYHKSDYLPVIVWGRNARFASDLRVGDRLHVTGRVQSRPYQKTLLDGTAVARIAYEVSASTVRFFEQATPAPHAP